MGRLDAVIFDLFGVIALPQSEDGRRELERLSGASGPRLWEAYWAHRHPYDAGELTGPEYWTRVGERLGVRYDAATVDALIAADLASWRRVDPGMVALVERLAADGVRLGLLSNIPEDNLRDFVPRNPWLRHFTRTTYSCRIGVAKPDPRAFTTCCTELGVAPQRALFVDDAARNVEAARRLGLAAIRFTSRADLEKALTDEYGIAVRDRAAGRPVPPSGGPPPG